MTRRRGEERTAVKGKRLGVLLSELGRGVRSRVLDTAGLAPGRGEGGVVYVDEESGDCRGKDIAFGGVLGSVSKGW